MSNQDGVEIVEEDEPSFPISNKAYDLLRFVAVIVLPAIGALYFGLAQIWGLPKAEEVVGTITVVDAFAGLLLRTLRKSYENSDARYDGAIVVLPGEDEDTSLLNVSLDPAAIADKDEVLVKVKKG